MAGDTFPARALASAAFLAIGAAAGAAAATEVGEARKLGLGIAVGEPSGIGGKYWLSGINAVDFGLSWHPFYRHEHCDQYNYCYQGERGVSLFGDYLWHPSVLARGSARFGWHIGVGGRLATWTYRHYYRGQETSLALRGPIGFDIALAQPPFIELTVEAAPTLYLLSTSQLTAEGSVGVRLYF